MNSSLDRKELEALRGLLELHGSDGAARITGIPRGTLLRAAAGDALRTCTQLAIRAELSRRGGLRATG